VTTDQFSLFTMAAAAAVALWTIARFPDLGPSRLRPAAVVLGATVALTAPVVILGAPAATGRLGEAVTALLVVLPALVLQFWAAGGVILAIHRSRAR
jgi:hypothetical protein